MSSELTYKVPVVSDAEMRKILIASCVGTMIEWYDFYIFGSLSFVISSKFYNTGTPVGDTIAFLATFAIGFMVRPFGSIVFGYIGDRFGRKFTFLLTLLMMGVCTFLVGCLPTRDMLPDETKDVAGVLLIILRIVQGLALGGEYGGATTYIAEHSPSDKRGYWTSFIQTTATLGLFFSLVVISIFYAALGRDTFFLWGWRLPFLLSILLVGVSVYIRLQLKESPMFQKLKDGGAVSKNPLVDSFCKPYNLKYVILALVGATMGQGAVWYTGQFYALFYLQTIFKIDLVTSNIIVLIAVVLATPFFVVVGYFSDKYGRKPFMVAGLFLAVITWYPIYMAMHYFRYAEVASVAKWDPVLQGVMPLNANYNPYALCFFVWLQTMYVTLVYGPIAAFLVELFPTSIRYTSLSVPYHIGNGVFGGLVPVVGLIAINSTGNIYAGLWYPLAVAGTCLVIMLVFVPETKDLEIFETPKDQKEAQRVDDARA